VSAAQTRETSREGRWRRWLLVVSLALNLLVLGLVAGAVLRGGPPGGGARVDLTPGPLLRAFEAEDRAAIRAGVQARRPLDRRARIEMRRDMRAMRDALRAETFEPARIRALMDRQFARLRTIQGRAADQVLDQLATMSPAERRALADRFEAEMRGGVGPRDHGQGGHGD
jgi:uncharacterized membrane protein